MYGEEYMEYSSLIATSPRVVVPVVFDYPTSISFSNSIIYDQR